jgi:hypothetical protein
MAGIIVNGQELAVPSELSVKNFGDPAVFRFKNQARSPAQVSSVVVHETVTTSWATTVAVLKQRGLGVHFIADHDGTIYQHADLLLDEMWHASQFNGISVGIETVNPYEPQYAPKDGPWTRIIDAPWAAGAARQYVVPTPAQSESVCQLLNFLTSAAVNPVAIPQLWAGFQHTHTLAMGRIPSDVQANPGIHAHMYFGHADGAWLVLYAWLRLEVLLPPEIAYEEAAKLATGAHSSGVDLSKYFDSNPYLES